ncbi:U2 small nuclear ribonucleoprotein B'' [Tolypocladium ophioglossoides CBS 100239]|uniref:U2 small nuclear ribonucleoprotein B n=1 Tax=Tolypocladium ophioglossoides (strain CBS 100239) TaxID=1163406 RepID=A0A0L0N6H3_TOLOC|nr:U2 small nuclear ribonucleoprotein B'' [Tolypocladium ophioglossoides CBS 100239]
MATAVPTRSLAPNASLPAKVNSTPPNQTLYVTNLPSTKIQKADIRTALYMLFSTYGPVLDVVALKTMSMRGQAHIVYRDVQTSTQAMRHLNGQTFLGRPLKIEYAKSKSHFVSKLDGTFKIPSASGAAAVEQTELQRSIFDAPPPGSVPATSISAKPANAADHIMNDAGTPESRGQKRTRDDEDDESEEDVAMEEDSDDE